MHNVSASAVKCKCGKTHNTKGLGPQHDGSTLTCEQCGKQYQIKVISLVYVVDDKGKALKEA